MSIEAATVERRNRLGRPRNRPIGVHAQPREEILAAAAILFETHGFGATTTRQIAAAAGLEQGSIFHYFSRKDELLAELLDQTLEPALAYAAWLDRQPIPIDQKLYLLAYRDTLNICSGPHNLAMLMHLPEAKRLEFKSYWEKRLTLKRTYRRYILAGLRAKTFSGMQGALGADLVFAMVESTIEWFDRSRDNAVRTADRVAAASLRLLLFDSRRIGEVVSLASTRLMQGPQGAATDSPISAGTAS